MCSYKNPNIVDETIGSTDIGMQLTTGTGCDNPLATEPLAVGARVEFCYPSSDSFVALNEEAIKAQRTSDGSANVGTFDRDEGHAKSLRRFRDLILDARMIRDVGKNISSKLSNISPLQALRTLELTIDEVVRFDNKIHDVPWKFDHTKSWA